MHALMYSELKEKRASFDDLTYQDKEKINYSKSSVDVKFYQKLSVVILTLFSFLIIPESPKDSEVLCRKYHSVEACIVW